MALIPIKVIIKYPLLLMILNCFCLNGQNVVVDKLDSMALSIDYDISLVKSEYHLDTSYTHKLYGKVRCIRNFTTFSNPINGQVKKIILHDKGIFYGDVIIYYKNKYPIKGEAKGEFIQTDTNPRFKTNSVAYFKKGKSIYEHDSIENKTKKIGFGKFPHLTK